MYSAITRAHSAFAYVASKSWSWGPWSWTFSCIKATASSPKWGRRQLTKNSLPPMPALNYVTQSETQLHFADMVTILLQSPFMNLDRSLKIDSLIQASTPQTLRWNRSSLEHGTESLTDAYYSRKLQEWNQIVTQRLKVRLLVKCASSQLTFPSKPPTPQSIVAASSADMPGYSSTSNRRRPARNRCTYDSRTISLLSSSQGAPHV